MASRRFRSLLFGILGCFTGVFVEASTTTPRTGMVIPAFGDLNWDVQLSADFNILDTSMCVQALANTFSSTQTFTQPVIIQPSQPLRFYDATTHYIQFQTPATVTTTNFTWPAADGANGQFIQTNGSGVLSFGAASGGGASTLAIQKNAVNISSPTVAINFLAPPFTVSLVNGSTSQVAIDASSATLQGNTFNQANKLVQLDNSTRLPVVDGSQLTALPGGSTQYIQNSLSPTTTTQSFTVQIASVTGGLTMVGNAGNTGNINLTGLASIDYRTLSPSWIIDFQGIAADGGILTHWTDSGGIVGYWEDTGNFPAGEFVNNTGVGSNSIALEASRLGSTGEAFFANVDASTAIVASASTGTGLLAKSSSGNAIQVDLGTVVLNPLTPSQFVKTNASKALVSSLLVTSDLPLISSSVPFGSATGSAIVDTTTFRFDDTNFLYVGAGASGQFALTLESRLAGLNQNAEIRFVDVGATKGYFGFWNNNGAGIVFADATHTQFAEFDPSTRNVNIDQGLTVSTFTATSFIQEAPKTHAAITALTPGGVGQKYYCSDCAVVPECISTGTVVGAWSLVTSRASVCQ